jgi:hypothetical protein
MLVFTAQAEEAMHLSAGGDHSKAIEQSTISIELAPRSHYYTQRGLYKIRLWRRQLGRLDQNEIPAPILLDTAISDFDNAHNMDNADLKCLLLKAICLVYLVRWSDAVSVFGVCGSYHV